MSCSVGKVERSKVQKLLTLGLESTTFFQKMRTFEAIYFCQKMLTLEVELTNFFPENAHVGILYIFESLFFEQQNL